MALPADGRSHPWAELQLVRGVPWALLLAAAIGSSAYAARTTHDGVDFTNNVWGPVRGLLSGHNPYDPANTAYLHEYRLSLPAGLYTPTVLLMHAPLASLTKSWASDVMAMLDAIVVWVGVLLLVRPRSPSSCAIAAAVGTLVALSATVQDSVAFGQIAPWAFLGLASLVSTLTAPVSRWWPAAGVVLISLKPQSMVPILVLLGLLGAWRVLARAAVLIVVTSLPGFVLFLRSDSGLLAAGGTIRENLRFFAHVPENDLHNTLNNRIDMLGVLSHVHGPVLVGRGWDVLAFTITTVLVAFILVVIVGPRTRACLDEPIVIALAAAFVVTSLYHQPYDQLLLFVAPLAVIGAALHDRRLTGVDGVLLAGGAALLVIEFVYRTGFRARMVAHGWSEQAVRATYFSAPTLLAVAAVAVGVFVYWFTAERRTSTEPIS